MNRFLPACLLVAAALLGVGLASAAPQPADLPQRLVVHFDALPAEVRPHGTYQGADVLAVDDALGFAVVQAPHGNAFLASALGRGGVRAVEPDGVSHSLGFTPNDPLFAQQQYAPQAIGAPAAWGTTLGSSAVTICLLDTGIRYTHEDLAGHYAGGIDLVNRDSDPWDDGGHGTRTAGVAAALVNNGRGVAGVANASIKEVKVLNSAGQAYDSDIATGIRWCADNGAKVVSISLGGPSPSTAVQGAVDYAWGKGLVLVAASGNSGCADCVLYPAAFTNVIAVGCVDQARALCSFTSKGPQVDLAAPGVNIHTTGFGGNSEYVYGGGTSLSTPHVAGAAALVWSAHPGYSNAQVRQALEATAQDVGPAGRDTASGAGMVRADLAIAYGAPAPQPTTTTPPATTQPANTTTQPTTTTQPSPSGFTASFTPASGINEWWVDVKVTASAAVASVAATVNGGAPHALAKTNWGTWAASFNAPKGASVVFTAKDAAGHTATSAPVAWMMPAGTSPAPATAPAPSQTPSFTATFTPKTLSNHWWVETSVSSASTIAKVEVRLNSGAWTVLPKTDWGTYAKSLNVPTGTQVVFRATNGGGATALSATYTEK
jgi:thermitase